MTALSPKTPEDESIAENAPSDLYIEVEAELTTGLADSANFASTKSLVGV
jgi:hypothetical protein